MNTITYLKQIYNYGDPIFLNSIRIGRKSKTAIKEEFYRAAKNGLLSRDGPGVYSLIDVDNGLSRVNTFEKIVEEKYIRDSSSSMSKEFCIYGYYSGLTFLNMIGLSQQVPAILEITTNKTSSKKRIYKALGREAIIRKPKIEIDFLNYKILQFLDMFHFLSLEEVKEKKNLIIKYAKKIGFNSVSFTSYIKYYGPKTTNKIVESGILDALNK